jgi:hypothetical protein
MNILSYLTEWGHIYLMHVCALTGILMLDNIRKEGLPFPSKALVIKPLVWALILAAFSSHAHTHYLSHFVSK